MKLDLIYRKTKNEKPFFKHYIIAIYRASASRFGQQVLAPPASGHTDPLGARRRHEQQLTERVPLNW
jgi:hypothetical protein